MEVKIKCITCGKKFKPKSYRHKFCCRRCFKIEARRKKNKETFPHYICPHCETKTKLTFSPKKDILKLSSFICPCCGKKRG